MKKLFVSFTNLLYGLRDGRVKESDLEGALFYFGCSKDYLGGCPADNADVQLAFRLNTSAPQTNEADRIYNLIKKTVITAEAEGRARFRKAGQYPSYHELNNLLEKNEIDVSSVKNIQEDELYCYPIIRERYSGLVEGRTKTR